MTTGQADLAEISDELFETVLASVGVGYDAPEGNAAYPPPADGNAVGDNRVVEEPATDMSTNRY